MNELVRRLFDNKILNVLSDIQGKNYVAIRETSRNTELPVASVYRVFKRLNEIGILKKEKIAGKTVYSVDKNNKLYKELESIIPTETPIEHFVNSIEKEKINQILLLDSGDKTASLWIVGNPTKTKINNTTQKIREKIGFSINAQIFTKEQVENLERLNIRPPIKKILFNTETKNENKK